MILHVEPAYFPLGKHISPFIQDLREIGDISRMRVGYSLKTKDGLLDIWTSTQDYIKLHVPRGRSADGFKASVCLFITNNAGTQSGASVRRSAAEKESITS